MLRQRRFGAADLRRQSLAAFALPCHRSYGVFLLDGTTVASVADSQFGAARTVAPGPRASGRAALCSGDRRAIVGGHRTRAFRSNALLLGRRILLARDAVRAGRVESKNSRRRRLAHGIFQRTARGTPFRPRSWGHLAAHVARF